MKFPLPLIGYPRQDEALFPGARDLLPISPENFCPQRRIWSCGVASMLMMAKSLSIEVPPWEECVRLLDTTEEHGTSTHNLERGMRKLFGPLGVHVESAEHATVRELARRLENQWLVAVSFREPEEHIGHHAVLQGVNDRALMFADPFYGRCSILPQSAFEWTTEFEHPVRSGWYCAVKRFR